MDLRVDMDAGTSDLRLAGLSLTQPDIIMGAGESALEWYSNPVSRGGSRPAPVVVNRWEFFQTPL